MVFLGNHTVGVTALSVLADCAEVVGVVAHPPDPEDGIRYQSVYEFAKSHKLPVIRGKAADVEVTNFIANTAPDLIWITDYRYLLPAHLLEIAPLGAINLHPSLLPKYRGRAPINWAILHGESKLGLTAHFVDEGMDSGDIIEQERFELASDEDVGDALERLLPLYVAVTRRILINLQTGHVSRRKQNVAEATSYPARKPKDGQIDWNQSADSILNLIRAVAAPYPGAFSFVGHVKIVIWKARLAQSCLTGQIGEIVGFEHDNPVVLCKEGALVLSKIGFPHDNSIKLVLGDKLTFREYE